MAKLRHVAIAASDLEGAASFYKQAFEMQEVGRVDNEIAKGIFLSDGTVNLAILQPHTDQLGRGTDYRGLHHLGFVVEDLDEAGKKLEELGAACFVQKPEQDTQSFFEVKHRGPDGVVLDISDRPWPGSAGLDDGPASRAEP